MQKQSRVSFALSSLGDLLVSLGHLDNDELAFALTEQVRTREKLGQILIRLGFVTEPQLKHALDIQAQLRGRRPEAACVALLREQIETIRRAQNQTHELLAVGRALTA